MSAKRRIVPVFVPHAGCQHACVFCNQREIAGEGTFSVGALTAEIDAALSRMGEGKTPELAFYGGSFTAIPKPLRVQYLMTAKQYIDRGAIASLRASTRPDAISDAVIDEFLAYGGRLLELGAQSMDDDVLRAAGRGHSAADTVFAANLLRGRDVPFVLQMMVGLPGEPPGGAVETAKQIAALSPAAVRIYPVAVMRGTELARLWRAGAYTPLSIDEAVCRAADALRVFEDAGIPVIRIGLQATEGLSSGAVLAGAYHPALGEMVRSRLALSRAQAAIRAAGPRGEMTLFVPPGQVSRFVGQRRGNVEALRAEFGISALRVREDGGLRAGEVYAASGISKSGIATASDY